MANSPCWSWKQPRRTLRHFGSYHKHPVLSRRGDRVFSEDMNLLLYYHSRREGYGFEGAAAGGPTRTEAA